MTLFHQSTQGEGLAVFVVRLVFGGAMALFIVLGFRAVRRRDFTTHSAWMIRAYAIGVAAGTQVLLMIPAAILAGTFTEITKAVLLTAAWLINLAVAERVIRRSARRDRTFDRDVAQSAPVS